MLASLLHLGLSSLRQASIALYLTGAEFERSSVRYFNESGGYVIVQQIAGPAVGVYCQAELVKEMGVRRLVVRQNNGVKAGHQEPNHKRGRADHNPRHEILGPVGRRLIVKKLVHASLPLTI